MPLSNAIIPLVRSELGMLCPYREVCLLAISTALLCCSLTIVYCSLTIVYCSLTIVYCSLTISYCLLTISYCKPIGCYNFLTLGASSTWRSLVTQGLNPRRADSEAINFAAPSRLKSPEFVLRAVMNKPIGRW